MGGSGEKRKSLGKWTTECKHTEGRRLRAQPAVALEGDCLCRGWGQGRLGDSGATTRTPGHEVLGMRCSRRPTRPPQRHRAEQTEDAALLPMRRGPEDTATPQPPRGDGHLCPRTALVHRLPFPGVQSLNKLHLPAHCLQTCSKWGGRQESRGRRLREKGLLKVRSRASSRTRPVPPGERRAPESRRRRASGGARPRCARRRAGRRGVTARALTTAP